MRTSFDSNNTALLSVVLVVAASLWGLYWWPIRQVEAAGLSPLWTIVTLSFAPLPFMAAYTAWRGAQVRGMWRDALIAGLLVGSAMLLYSLGLLFTSVVRATMFFYLTPVWGTLLGIAWHKERVLTSRWVAIGLGLGGLALMLSGGHAGAPAINVGDLFGLVSGVMWALGSAFLLSRPALPTHAAVTAQFGAGTALALGAAALYGEMVPPVQVFAEGALVPIAVSALIITPSMFLCLWCAQRLPTGRVGLLMMSEVIVAVVSAALLIPEETMTVTEWTGAALIVVAGVTEVTVQA